MVTVADLLARSRLALVPVHLPARDLPLRWVATSELDDPTPYLEGGEVLLTTGLETRDWHDEWRSYVARLTDAGTAALGFAVGLTHAEPPSALVVACEEQALNLFTVPRATTFVAVSRAAAALLEAERDDATRRTLDAQRALTEAALEVDGSTAVLRQLAAVLAGAAAVVGRDGLPLDGPHGDRATLDHTMVREEVVRIRSRGLRAAASAVSRGGTTVVRPLGVRSRPDAWLAAFVPGRPGDTERVAVSTAASLLSLALERRREQRKTDRQLRARAVELLLAGDLRTAQIVLGAASAAAARPRLPRRLRVLRAQGPAEALEDALAVAEQHRLLAAVAGGQLTALAGAQRAQAVADQLAGSELEIGIGCVAAIEETAASHRTAGHALEAAGPTAPVRRWDDLARTGVVGLLGPDRAAAFARSFLAPLDDLVLQNTLATFLRRHGSRGDTAAELGVHRNTVRNRIAQIESRLGASLDDPQVRVDAWVALQAGSSSRRDHPTCPPDGR